MPGRSPDALRRCVASGWRLTLRVRVSLAVRWRVLAATGVHCDGCCQHQFGRHEEQQSLQCECTRALPLRFNAPRALLLTRVRFVRAPLCRRLRGQAFLAWTRDTHMFEKIKISEANGKKFSKRARALWDLNEEDNTYMLESVPFTHASEKVTPDNRQYNILHTRLTKAQWKLANEEARRRMIARVRGRAGRLRLRSRAMGAVPAKLTGHACACRASVVVQDPTGEGPAEGEEESKGAAPADATGGSQMASTVAGGFSREDRKMLYRMGLVQLGKWVEADAEAVKEKEKEKVSDKAAEAKRRHTAWANRKVGGGQVAVVVKVVAEGGVLSSGLAPALLSLSWPQLTCHCPGGCCHDDATRTRAVCASPPKRSTPTPRRCPSGSRRDSTSQAARRSSCDPSALSSRTTPSRCWQTVA